LSGKHFSVKITPHVFRHTIATVLIRNGMPVEQVQRFLGHANINTTMVYAEVSDDDVRRSHFMYAA
jgi:integrase/recombinase XerD